MPLFVALLIQYFEQHFSLYNTSVGTLWGYTLISHINWHNKIKLQHYSEHIFILANKFHKVSVTILESFCFHFKIEN